MANLNQISLKVCGNPDANSGFQTMVIFNSPSIDIKDTVYAGFDANSYFFTIRIEKTQIVYKLVKNNVSSFGASRQGCLVIGIAIPKGYKLDAGISPYDVLMELKKGFLARCMTCKDPVAEKYEFNSNRVQSNILDDIAGSFSLVSSQTPYRTMSMGAPVAYVTVPEEKIKLLMNDVQYPAFTKFSEIVVAATVQSTNYNPITNISIPRIAEYSICNDGVFLPTVVSDPKQLQTVEGNGDTRFYENESLMFTLEELLNGESVPNVSIDRVNEIIYVSSKALIRPLTRKINVVFVPKEAETYFSTRRYDWNLLYDNQPIPLKQDLSFELIGEQLKALYAPQSFKIQQSHKNQFDVKNLSVSSNEIRVIAEKVRQTAYPSVGGGKTGGIAQTTNIDACEVQFSSQQAYKHGRCKMQFYDTDGVLLQSTLIDKRNDGNQIARVYVPKSWSGSNIQVRLKNKNEYWEGIHPLGKDVNGVIELRDKDFILKSIGFFSKHSRRLISLILLLLSLLMGGAIGIYIGKNWLGNENDSSSEQTETFSCLECGKICATETELEYHIAEAHSKEDNQYNASVNTPTLYCPYCNEGPFEQSGLDAHVSECPKKVEYCETCGRTFQNRNELNSHIQKEHSAKICDVCGQTFNDKNSLDKHKKKNHHFECDECGPDVWYFTKEQLDAHKRNDKVKGTNERHKR